MSTPDGSGAGAPDADPAGVDSPGAGASIVPAAGDCGGGGRLTQLRRLLDTGRDADPQAVADGVRRVIGRRRWLLPLVVVGQTLDALVAGVLLLLRNWKLLLVELVPAIWLGALTWDWRARVTGRLPLAEVHGAAAVGVAVLVMAATYAAYWCNALFAFTATRPPPVDLRAAARSARAARRTIATWALLAGAAHALVAVFVTRTNLPLYSIALGAVVLVQMYGLVALPVALVAPTAARHRRTLRERAAAMVLTGAVSGVASAPGFLLNRLGLVFFAVGVPWLGMIVLVPAVLIQAAGAASARAVQLAARVQVREAGAGAVDDRVPPGSGSAPCTPPAPVPPRPSGSEA